MKMTPESVAEEQYKHLKEHAIKILQEITHFLRQDNYSEIGKYLEHSPAGDEMGTSKMFINFNISDDSDGDDISDVIERLEQLKQMSKKK